MKFNVLLLSVLLAVAIKAQDIDSNDIPSACQSTCSTLVNLTQSCDNSTSGDSAYLSCVCGASNASSFIPGCGSCIANNGGDSNNDAINLSDKCQFSNSTSSSSSMGSSSTSSSSMISSSSSARSSSMTSGSSSASRSSMMTSAASTGGASSSRTTSSPAAATSAATNAGERLAPSAAAVMLILAPLIALL